MRFHRSSPLTATAIFLLGGWMALRFGRAFLTQCAGAFAPLGR